MPVVRAGVPAMVRPNCDATGSRGAPREPCSDHGNRKQLAERAQVRAPGNVACVTSSGFSAKGFPGRFHQQLMRLVACTDYEGWGAPDGSSRGRTGPDSGRRRRGVVPQRGFASPPLAAHATCRHGNGRRACPKSVANGPSLLTVHGLEFEWVGQRLFEPQEVVLSSQEGLNDFGVEVGSGAVANDGDGRLVTVGVLVDAS